MGNQQANTIIGRNLTTSQLRIFVVDMHPDINASPSMVRSDADIPYINDIPIAHRATTIRYRTGPAHRVQLVVPSLPPPSPQSAVIQTLRSTRPRSTVSSNLRAAFRQVQSTDREAGSEASKVENAENGHIWSQASSHVDHGEEWYSQSQVQISHEQDRPRDRGLRAADFDDSKSEDTVCENDSGKDVGPIVVRTHRALCAADFEESDDEEALCEDGDIRGLDLEANTRWFNSTKELKTPRGHQLTAIQLRIQENVLRDIVQEALQARRNGEIDSSIFSNEAPEEEDGVLEMILELMEVGQSMIDAGALQEDEGGDVQMMLRNNLSTRIRKATRPFRPSGIDITEAELTQCLEAFRQLRLKLLQEMAGMSMAEILEKRSLDLRPR